MVCFYFTKYYNIVLGIIKYLCIHIYTYKSTLYICEQVRDIHLINLFSASKLMETDENKSYLWETFHNWWFWTSDTRADLLILWVFWVDRQIRICFYLSCDMPFIYDLAQRTGDPVPSHMCKVFTFCRLNPKLWLHFENSMY